MAPDNFWSRFRRWRRVRPFWGGLLLLLSSLELFLSANMSVAGMQIHLGPQGFLSYLLPVLLLMCGLAAWFSPAQRMFYGVVALLAALYTFLGLNLGGFFLGMLLGIVGGALLIAWGPPRVKPGAGLIGSPLDNEPDDHQPDDFDDQHPADIDATQQIDIAGHDDRPDPAHPRAFLPGFTDEEPPRPPSRFGRNPKALAVLLIPLAMTATLLVAGSRSPASADDTCPKGLPSRSYATSAPATVNSSATVVAARKKAIAKKATTPAAAKTTAAPLSPSPSAKGDGGSGNVIVDGLHDVVDGVGNLLGLGDEESPSPSGSPSPSATTTPAEPTTTAPTTTPPTTGPTTAPTSPAVTTAPATTATPTKATSSATVQPTTSSDVIPCLGPRVIGKIGDSNDIPQVADKPGLMEVEKLELYDSTYDGVVDMPTAAGSYKALKFTMTKAVNTPFSLTIAEPNGGTTKITSKSLVTEGTVKFYTSELKGLLFGLIPVTFTPDSPPPLTLPYLMFTDAQIKLGYVRCDTLTGTPLKIAETS